jgi:hypothetical protein
VGLVAAPPNADRVRAEIRSLQLIALSLPSTAPSAAILDIFVREQGKTVLPVTPVVRTTENLVGPVRSTAFLARVIDSTAQLRVDPAMEGQQVTNAVVAASPGVITDPILSSIVLGGLFFVVIPAVWVVIIVTSAINVVLGALGLPVLPNVPDPPFGLSPQLNAATAPAVEANFLPSDPVVPQTNKTASLTGIAETDPPSNGGVERDTHKTASSVGIGRTNRPLCDPAVPDTDAASMPKPLTNVAEDSPVFTPKHRAPESRPPVLIWFGRRWRLRLTMNPPPCSTPAATSTRSRKLMRPKESRSQNTNHLQRKAYRSDVRC